MGAPVAVRIFYTAYFYFLFMLFIFLALLGQLTVILLCFPLIIVTPCFRQRFLSFIPKYCMNAVLRLAFFWKVKVIREHPKKKFLRRTIMMANHSSSADPWVLDKVSLCFPTIYVIKRSLIKIPIAGWCTLISGHLTIQFTKDKGGWGTKPGATKELMNDAKKLVDNGCVLSVFPEGTRSTTGRLQPFKDGFFRFAVENDCDILPVGLHSTPTLWPLGSKLVDQGTCYVAVGDPISSEGLTADQLKEKTHVAIYELLKMSPDFDESTEKPLTRMASSRGHGI